MNRRLATHISNYSIGNLLVTVSGLISFPIFTRIFSVAEYGILNLISATLGLLFAISKLGIQHSIVRFYGEVRAGKLDATIPQYLSTTFFGMTAVGLLVTVAWALVSLSIPANWWSDPRVSGLFLITAVLLFIRTADSALVNFLRAEERSGLYNLYNVIKRYGTLALVLLVLFYITGDLYGYFWATIAAEGLIVTGLLLIMRRTHQFSPDEFSPKLFRSMLAYGIPMIAFELSAISLNIGDRYVIEVMLGSEALGIYSAGYNFSQYVQAVFMAAVGQAALPMFVRCWEDKGPEATKRFVRQTMHYYLLAALPMVAGVSAIGREAMVILASDKYADAAALIPFVAGGMAIEGGLAMLAVGIYLSKRTRFMAIMMVICAILNIGMNVLLIPHLGINGAALATLVSYGILGGGAWIVSQRFLATGFPWLDALKFGLLSTIMYLTVSAISFASDWATLVARVVAGVALYSILVLVFDQQTRDMARRVINKFSSAFSA